MTRQRLRVVHLLLVGGVLAFAVATLSVVDVFLPRPHDGVVLEADAPGRLVVREVVAGSGADRAGIEPGDRIVGIGRNALRSTTDAARFLQDHRIGDRLPYLVETPTGRRTEVEVELAPRQMGHLAYLASALLGFAFFGVGLFVVSQKPTQRSGQLFFTLCTLFLLFLVCRLRPASYSGVNRFVLHTGTAALLLLPGSFLHFFLVFPRPVWWRSGGVLGWLHRHPAPRHAALTALYLVPLATYGWSLHRSTKEMLLVSGAPVANWWVLAIYMTLGLGVLARSARTITQPREQRGVALVLFGAVFGLVPFLVLAVAFPSFLRTERFLYLGVAPLILIPITFAYAIVRFQLLHIRVILEKSLLYTATTAVVTVLYALGIALFDASFRDTSLARSPFFPLLFALVIVFLFEPLRRRLQGPVDRFFFADRHRLERTIAEMRDAFSGQVDLGDVVRDLVESLPHRVGLRFAALYLWRDQGLLRVAGPRHLPSELPDLPALHRALERNGNVSRLDSLGRLQLRSLQNAELLVALEAAGVEVVGRLASPRRRLGMILLSGKKGQVAIDDGELELLRGLMAQAAIALETSLLLKERTKQAELDQQLRIAATIQESLLPRALRFAPGWHASFFCRPAREVGGDFITELPGPSNGSRAIVFGDVSGKSVPGALMMMAAQEILQSLAMIDPRPESLLNLANRRLYELKRQSFVALGYLASAAGGTTLQYLLAGQPNLLRRRRGRVEELPLPTHRLPLGALKTGGYRLVEVTVEPGDVVLGYSDGVIEALSPEGEAFGSERLARVLASAPQSCESTVDSVVAAVDTFTNGREAYDDITLVALEKGPAHTSEVS